MSLAGVNCTGSEAGLCDCHTPNGIINSQCSSTSDAGVVCQSELYNKTEEVEFILLWANL